MGIIIPTECGYFEGQMENRKPVKVFLEAAVTLITSYYIEYHVLRV